MRAALQGALLALVAGGLLVACGGHGHGGVLPSFGARSGLAATADYATVVLGDGPTAYYRLDDTGSSAADASGHGLTGAIGTSVTKGVSGLLLTSSDTAQSVPGTASAAGTVNVPATSALQPASAVSLEAWLRFAVSPKLYSVVAAYGSDSSYAPYDLFFRSGNTLVAQFFTSAGVLEVADPTPLAANTTYHIVSTFDGSTGRLYVNGVQVASGAKTGTLANYAPNFGFTIGDDAAFSDPAFAGTVDEVAVYAGKVLTAQQVQTHYNAGTSGTVTATPSPSPSPSSSPTSPPPPTATPSPAPTGTPPSGSALALTQTRQMVGSLSVTLARAPTSGDLLLAIGFNGKSTIGCGAGWTSIRFIAARYDDGRSCYRIASGDGATVTPFSGTAPADVSGYVWDITGQAASSFIDAETGAEGGSHSLTLTIAPSQAGDLIVGGAALNAALSGLNPAGYTQDFSATPAGTTGFSEIFSHKLGAAAGAQSVTWAFNSATDTHPVTAMMVAVRGGASATSPPSPPPSPTPAPTGSPSSVDWTTMGFDLQRTGYNPNERTLGASSFATLHSLWSQSASVSGGEIGEPVYASNVSINGQPANVLYAGGGTGIMFAINADTGATIWSKQLGATSYSCGTFTGTFGVDSAAVIDRARNRVYVGDGANNVHALDLSTGAEAAGWPVNIAAANGHDFIYAGLTLNPANGVLYAETATTCDISPWFGRIDAINTSTASIINTFFPAQGASGGGIWSFGGASVDPVTNDVFIAVGNGDTTNGGSQTAGYSEQIVQLSADVSTVKAHFYAMLPVAADADFGATPLLFQPPGCPPLLAAVNKSGLFVLYDRGNIGAGPTQSIQMSINTDNGDFIGVPAYDPVTNYVYVGLPATEGIYKPGLAAFRIAPTCTLDPTPAWAANFGADGALTNNDTPRSPITIANGVAYVSDYDTSTSYAFDAASGARLWSTPLSGKGIVGPIVVNGHLYVGNIGGAMTAWTP